MTDKKDAKILDVCCGGKMFYFDKDNENVIFMDRRKFDETLCDGRKFVVEPDIIADFRDIPFEDEAFDMVVFDPPHLLKISEKSWLAKKYGKLDPDTYKKDITEGFSECFRVLKPSGTLIFKWSEADIKTSEIIKLSPIPPIFGNRGGKNNKTHWLVFMKV